MAKRADSVDAVCQNEGIAKGFRMQEPGGTRRLWGQIRRDDVMLCPVLCVAHF